MVQLPWTTQQGNSKLPVIVPMQCHIYISIYIYLSIYLYNFVWVLIWHTHTEPNHGNGYDHEKYSWTQTLAELTLHIPLPEGTKSKNVLCDIKMKSLQVGLKGEPPILEVRDKLSLYDHNTYMFKLCRMVFISRPLCDNKGTFTHVPKS